MSDSVIATVFNNLYDQLVAETTISAEIAAGRLKAFDGPAVNDFSAVTMMTIGGFPIVEDEEPDTNSDWNWASLGRDGANADVDEIWHIPCGISTMLGEANSRAARTTALNIFAKAASFIRGTTLSIPQVMWAMPQVATIKQMQTQSGAECLILFSAHIQTRI